MTNQNVPYGCSFECTSDPCCSTDCHSHVWCSTLNSVILESVFLLLEFVFMCFLFSPSTVHWSIFTTDILLILHVIIGYSGLFKPFLGLIFIYCWLGMILASGMSVTSILVIFGVIDFHHDEYGGFIRVLYCYLLKYVMIFICIFGIYFSEKLSTDPSFLSKCGVTGNREDQHVNENVDKKDDPILHEKINNDFNGNKINKNLLKYDQTNLYVWNLKQSQMENQYRGVLLPVPPQYQYHYPIEVESSDDLQFFRQQMDRYNRIFRPIYVPFQYGPPSPLYQRFHPQEYVTMPQFSYIPIPNQNINQQNPDQSQEVHNQSSDNVVVSNNHDEMAQQIETNINENKTN